MDNDDDDDNDDDESDDDSDDGDIRVSFMYNVIKRVMGIYDYRHEMKPRLA